MLYQQVLDQLKYYYTDEGVTQSHRLTSLIIEDYNDEFMKKRENAINILKAVRDFYNQHKLRINGYLLMQMEAHNLK